MAVQGPRSSIVQATTLVRRLVLSTSILGALTLGATSAAAGDGAIHVLILKEQGVGSAAQAQGYVDRLIAQTAKVNGWAAASAKYVTNRAGAETFMHEADPHYGILSLPAFLGLRARHGMEVVGKATVTAPTGEQYFVVSSKHASAEACKGKSLATNHGGDERFIDAVVSGGAFKLSEFTVVTTTRPVQTLKKVIAGEAECALIDDAQLAELSSIEGGGAVAKVWSSSKLPPMVVVAFPSAPAAERKAFQGNLSKVCTGDGAAVCAESGLQALGAASSSDYQAVIDAYSKK